MTRLLILLIVGAFCVWTAAAPDPRTFALLSALSPDHAHEPVDSTDGSFYCPMDPDYRSARPGQCPRCGMTLAEGAPDLTEYPLDLQLEPVRPTPGSPVRLTFGVTDPHTGTPVRRFETVHEQLYHVFVVNQDLSFFLHTHPERDADTDFHLDTRLPAAGLYRVLSDFYPSGGTPQLITRSLIVPGDAPPVAAGRLSADLATKRTENASVDLALEDGHATAGELASLVFKVSPNDHLEPYLGAWGHMLAVSDDLIDLMHQHPVGATDRLVGRKDIEFQLVFPRAGIYRVWAQFQRMGVVNTVAFDIPVVPAHH